MFIFSLICMFDPEAAGLNMAEEELLVPESSIKKIAREYGLSNKEVKDAIRQSTTLFIHYIVDGCIQLHQNGEDDERPVALKPIDIIKVLENSGFPQIAKKVSK